MTDTDLPDWFLRHSPLTMDALRGPDEQYRAGARDMLSVVRSDALKERVAIGLSEWLHRTASPGLEIEVLPHAREIVAVVLTSLDDRSLEVAS